MADEKTLTYAGFSADQWRSALGLVMDAAAADGLVGAMFDAIEAGANAESVGPDTLALFLFVDDECRSRLHALLSQFPAMASAVEEEAKALEAQGLRRRE